MKIIIQRVKKAQVSIEGQGQHADFFRRRRQDESVCQGY